MAATLAAAIAEVEGPEFDLLVGYVRVPRRAAPTEDRVRTAFADVDYAEFRRIERMLASRYRCHITDAEEAVHDVLLELYETRRELFRRAPSNWLGLLYEAARFRLIDIQIGARRTTSVEEGIEEIGDAFLDSAVPCLPETLGEPGDARLERIPRSGEEWSRNQILGALQRFRDHYGRPARARDCRVIHGLPAPSVIHRHFGAFAEALLEAGMTPEGLGKRRSRWAPVEAAKACRCFRDRNGLWPDWRDVKRAPGVLPSTSVMVRLFGGTKSVDVQLGSEAILAGNGSR